MRVNVSVNVNGSSGMYTERPLAWHTTERMKDEKPVVSVNGSVNERVTRPAMKHEKEGPGLVRRRAQGW